MGMEMEMGTAMATERGQRTSERQRITRSGGSESQPYRSVNNPDQLFQRIAPNVKLGRRVKIFAFTNLYGCEIGDDVKIGAFVEIQKGASIGCRCKISSHSFI